MLLACQMGFTSPLSRLATCRSNFPASLASRRCSGLPSSNKACTRCQRWSPSNFSRALLTAGFAPSALMAFWKRSAISPDQRPAASPSLARSCVARFRSSTDLISRAARSAAGLASSVRKRPSTSAVWLDLPKSPSALAVSAAKSAIIFFNASGVGASADFKLSAMLFASARAAEACGWSRFTAPGSSMPMRSRIWIFRPESMPGSASCMLSDPSSRTISRASSPITLR